MNLLGIVEVGGVDLVLDLGRLDVFLKSAEVVLAELLLGVGLETLIERRLLSFVVLSVDGGAGSLGEGPTKEVLRLDLGHVAGVSWDVLRLQVLSGAAQPVFALL